LSRADDAAQLCVVVERQLDSYRAAHALVNAAIAG